MQTVVGSFVVVMVFASLGCSGSSIAPGGQTQCVAAAPTVGLTTENGGPPACLQGFACVEASSHYVLSCSETTSQGAPAYECSCYAEDVVDKVFTIAKFDCSDALSVMQTANTGCRWALTTD